MSDQHSITRKSILTHSGVFSLASVGYLASLVMSLASFGLWDVLGGVSFIFSLIQMRGTWKGFSDMDYSKANQSAWFATIGSIAAAIMGFM